MLMHVAPGVQWLKHWLHDAQWGCYTARGEACCACGRYVLHWLEDGAYDDGP